MEKYIPRLTAPSKTNKNYIHYSKGGYNTAIIIDKNTGSVLPNCVGYAQGRLLEILGAKAPNWKLPACNAEDWLETAQKNGFKTGMTPKLGAIAVFRAGATHNGSDGAGHVAVVEEIKANGDIVVSQSAYGGSGWYLSTLTKASGYIYSANRPLEGFVYCGIDFYADNQVNTTPKAVGYLDTATYSNKQLTVSGWAYKGAGGQNVMIKVCNGNKVVTSYTLIANKSRPDVKTVMKYSTDAVGYSDTKSLTLADGTYTVKAYIGTEQLVNSKTITVKNSLTATSYSDYAKGSNKYYYVQKKFKDWSTSKGAFSVWGNAYKTWNANKAQGYHVYDCNGKQLD